jgi:chemotaxis protein CheX
MDVKYINPFIESVLANLKQFGNIEAEKESLDIFKDKQTKTEISSIIGITGNLKGSAVISFPKPLAIKIASSMLMDDNITEVNNEVKDAIGEFSNIVIGNARNKIVDNGINIKISPPTIVVGENHKIFFPPNIPVIEVIFNAGDSKFYIIIGLKEK